MIVSRARLRELDRCSEHAKSDPPLASHFSSFPPPPPPPIFVFLLYPLRPPQNFCLQQLEPANSIGPSLDLGPPPHHQVHQEVASSRAARPSDVSMACVIPHIPCPRRSPHHWQVVRRLRAGARVPAQPWCGVELLDEVRLVGRRVLGGQVWDGEIARGEERGALWGVGGRGRRRAKRRWRGLALVGFLLT